MKEQAYQIQKNWCELIDFIKENIDEIHNMSEKIVKESMIMVKSI